MTTEQQIAKNPKRNEMVVINDDLETPSILDPAEGKIFITNRVGQQVMELADGTLSVDEIVDRIAEQFEGTEKSVMRNEICAFLENSANRGIIAWSPE
ncbi:MAG: PqqD family protein [bacterium]|nr:PqqD family protein [bacterium]